MTAGSELVLTRVPLPAIFSKYLQILGICEKLLMFIQATLRYSISQHVIVTLKHVFFLFIYIAIKILTNLHSNLIKHQLAKLQLFENTLDTHL